MILDQPALGLIVTDAVEALGVMRKVRLNGQIGVSYTVLAAPAPMITAS
jgi:hypothetical protein